jgi:ATP synthase F1 delta subunit
MDFLQELLEEETNQLFFNFLRVLALKKRLDLVFEIMDAFEAQYAKKQNRLVVNVQSAVALDESTKTELETFFTDSLKANVHVNFITKTDILGGLVVDMEGTIIDASLRRKFRELKKSLNAASVL